MLAHQVADPLEATAAVGQPAFDPIALGGFPAGALLDVVGHGLGCTGQPSVAQYSGPQAHRVYLRAVAHPLLPVQRLGYRYCAGHAVVVAGAVAHAQEALTSDAESRRIYVKRPDNRLVGGSLHRGEVNGDTGFQQVAIAGSSISGLLNGLLCADQQVADWTGKKLELFRDLDQRGFHGASCIGVSRQLTDGTGSALYSSPNCAQLRSFRSTPEQGHSKIL